MAPTYLDQKPAFIEEVKLPPTSCNTDGVDILAEEERKVHGE